MSIQLQIIQNSVNQCIKCELYKTKKNYVFARGNPQANMMIVAEAPGNDEDDAGLPFVGRAGQLLDRVIKSLGYDSNKDSYIANILKCHPPDNRRPLPAEVKSCLGYLEAQIDTVKPKVIIGLGNTAVQTLLQTKAGITKIRGQQFTYRSSIFIPTVHPSLILRSGGVNSIYFNNFRNDLKLGFELSQ